VIVSELRAHHLESVDSDQFEDASAVLKADHTRLLCISGWVAFGRLGTVRNLLRILSQSRGRSTVARLTLLSIVNLPCSLPIVN
jgi:hypothetical protein